MTSVGIDVGSKNIKVVVMNDGEVAAKLMGTGGFKQGENAKKLFEQALQKAGIDPAQVAHVTATGMGRNSIDFADSTVTDISAAARGAAWFFPGATTIVEVGAEESRSIKTDGRGKVLDSVVNEKCAAGSGSFTESMSRALGMSLQEFAEKSLESETKIQMSAQCTVFAESEVVSLIHQSTDKKDIARAVHDAIANRVSSMVRRVKLEGDVVLLGGLAYNRGFCKCLMEKLEVDELKIPEGPEFADGVGAAIMAAERAA